MPETLQLAPLVTGEEKASLHGEKEWRPIPIRGRGDAETPSREAAPEPSGATELARNDRDTDQSRHAGFEEAFLTHRTAIYGHVLRMVGQEADAEDLTVMAFEKALKAWDRRPPDAELRPWLFRIATNSCLDELRRRKRIEWRPWESFIGLFHPSQVAPDDPEKEALRSEKADLIHAALAQLSPRDRAALIMRECYGLSNDEVGRALSTSRDAAKMVLFRARERLRTTYLGMGGDPPEGATKNGSPGPKAGRDNNPAGTGPRVKDAR